MGSIGRLKSLRPRALINKAVLTGSDIEAEGSSGLDESGKERVLGGHKRILHSSSSSPAELERRTRKRKVAPALLAASLDEKEIPEAITPPTQIRDVEDVVPSFTEREQESIRKLLLVWYDSNHRILPWRVNAFSTHDCKQRPNKKLPANLVSDMQVIEKKAEACVSRVPENYDSGNLTSSISVMNGDNAENTGEDPGKVEYIAFAKFAYSEHISLPNSEFNINVPAPKSSKTRSKRSSGILNLKESISDPTQGAFQEGAQNTLRCASILRSGKGDVDHAVKLEVSVELHVKASDRQERVDEGAADPQSAPVLQPLKDNVAEIHGQDAMEAEDTSTNTSIGVPFAADEIGNLADVGHRAYAVWVSEVMCQQTRIATVIDYYTRWMARWPTLSRLAAASMEEVNEMWAGLGYYRRARFLLEGAKHVMQQLDGKLPSAAVELAKIPGIGRYTAGAISSIAFNQVAPLVDGNVVRVLSRLRALSGDPKKGPMVALHWALAGELVDPSRPGDFNQALMELGATVCTSTSPGCTSCPVSSHCLALAQVRARTATHQAPCKQIDASEKPPSVTDFPTKTLKAAPREENVAICVLELVQSADERMEDGVRKGQGGNKAVAEAPGGRVIGERAEPGVAEEEPDDFGLDLRRSCKGKRSSRAKTPAPDVSHELPALKRCLNSTEERVSDTGMVMAKKQNNAKDCVAGVGRKTGGRFLLVQRPDGGLLGGQWEFPSVALVGPKVSLSARKTLVNTYLSKLLGLPVEGVARTGRPVSTGQGLRVVEREEVGEYCHVFSHIRQHMKIERMVVAGLTPGAEEALVGSLGGVKLRWETRDSLMKTGLTSGVRKVFNMTVAKQCPK